MNLIQLDHSIFAIARDPIRHPDVGTIRFVNASPSWNATTAVCRETPNRSDSGAMIGIVRSLSCSGYNEEVEYGTGTDT